MNDEQRVWDILEKSSIGMLTTRFGGGLRARPLDARPDRTAGLIFFITDVRGLKDDEIALAPEVCFTVVDADDKAFVDHRPGRAAQRCSPRRHILEEDR